MIKKILKTIISITHVHTSLQEENHLKKFQQHNYTQVSLHTKKRQHRQKKTTKKKRKNLYKSPETIYEKNP